MLFFPEPETTANETRLAGVSAITKRAPYGPQTDDTKAVLGSQQEVRFVFC